MSSPACPDTRRFCRPAGLPVAVPAVLILLVSTAVVTEAAIVTRPVEQVAPELFEVPEGDQAPTKMKQLEQAVKAFRGQDFDRCWELLRAAVKRDPNLPPARLMLARFFLIHDQVAPGRIALEQAAVEAPEYPGVYVSFGEFALREGRVADARLHFEEVLRLVERGTWGKNHRRAFLTRTYAGLASVAEWKRDWSSARSRLSDWLELAPSSGLARHRLARVLLALDEERLAYQQLQQAEKDDPSRDPAAVTMGWLYAHAGSPEKAAEWMQYAVKAAPEDPKAHLGVAAWLLQQDQPQEARDHAQTAAELDPGWKEARLLCGIIAQRLKDYPGAERSFDVLYQEDPADLRVNNYLALALVEQPDEAKRRRALQLAEENARLHPDSQEALATAGWVYYRMNRLDDAEQSLQGARARGPMRPNTAYFLACVMAEQGRFDEVRGLLSPALDGANGFPFQSEARELLDRATQALRQAGGDP